jgi:hypothetical protein
MTMRKNFRSTLAVSVTAVLLATGLAILPAQADDAQAATPVRQTATPIDATARNTAGCGFQVKVHFIDGRIASARWEMAPGSSPTATAFCRGRAAA